MEALKTIFLWETIAGLCFLAALVLGIGFSMKILLKGIVSLFSKGRKHSSILATAFGATGEYTSLRGDVINKFVEEKNSTNYSIKSAYDSIVVDYVLEQLGKEFKVETLTQICGLNSTYCNTISKITDAEGNDFFIGTSWSERPLVDTKGKLLYLGNDLKVLEYGFQDEDGDDVILLSNMVEVLFPIELGEYHPSVLKVISILKQGTVDHVRHGSSENSINIEKLVYNTGLGYSLRSFKVPVVQLSNKVLDLSYGEVSYDFQGKTHQIPVSKAFPILLESLKLGENCLLFGNHGVGKSTLWEQIQARIAGEDVRVIVMTPAQIRELQNSEAKSAFENALVKDQKVIIFVDEAEKLLQESVDGLHTDDASIILQMMSGGLQKAWNCQLVLAFNALPSQLNKALFRKGRAGMIFNLEPLQRREANALIQEIKRMYPDRMFDRDEYDKVLNASNMDVKKQTYARPGQITLADLYACFTHKSVYSNIMKAIGVATKTEEVIAPSEGQGTVASVPKRKLTPKLVQKEIVPTTPLEKKEVAPQQQGSNKKRYKNRKKK